MPITPDGSEEEALAVGDELGVGVTAGVDVELATESGPAQGMYFHHHGALPAASTVIISVMIKLTLNS